MTKNLIWDLLMLTVFFTACGDDNNDTDIPKYENGVIVVNQGLFNMGTGTLTYKDRGEEAPVQDIYSDANEGAFLGNVAQSMIEVNGKNFISINNGGQVIVTHADEFTFIEAIGGIEQGRYFATNGDKLYLTAWGATGTDGRIYELDPNTNTISAFITVGNGPEGILFANDDLYVARGGGFGRDSTVLIIDTEDNEITNTLVVGDNPQLMVKDNDENVYVICSGYTDFNDPTNNTTGRLVKISGSEIDWSIEIPNGSGNLAIDADNGFLYFVSENRVVKQSINSTTLQTTEIRPFSAFALGFDEEENQLYMSDAKDFSSQGVVYRYSTSDMLIDSFPTGIIPGYFYFQ